MKFESENILGGDILENESRLARVATSISEKRALYQSKPEDFIGLPGYSDQAIQDELRRVEVLEHAWKENNNEDQIKEKVISDILEGVVIDQFSGEWFAGLGEGFFASKPDDYLRGVDAVVEFHNETGDTKDHVGFALDITHTAFYTNLSYKLSSLWKEIERGNLTEIKYFEDSNEDRSSIKLSRVIVGVSKEVSRDLITLYSGKKKEALSKHEFQYSLILQIKMQLEAQYEYIRHYARDEDPNNKYSIAKTEISAALKHINEIYELKKDEIESRRQLIEQDPIFRQIKDFYKEKAHDSRALAA